MLTPVWGIEPVAVVVSSFLLLVPLDEGLLFVEVLLELPLFELFLSESLFEVLLFVLSWLSVLFVVVPSVFAFIVILPDNKGQDNFASFPFSSVMFPPLRLTVWSCPLSVLWILYE